jgi:hypothetical protein
MTREIPDHRRPRVRQPPQYAGGDPLQPVEQLEDGRDEEQGDPRLDDHRIIGKRPNQGTGHHQEHQRGRGHEADANRDRGPSSTGDAARITAPDGMSNANRRRRGKPERDHECDRRHVERDLMRRQRFG